MARATRSTTNLEKSHHHLPQRPPTKKRKRLSIANDNDNQPSKLPRTCPPSLTSAADHHIHNLDASRILDVLELTDSQGLLDRVFPLPPSAPTQGSFSLRALLRQPTNHPLWVLKAAVQNLFPLSSSQPRSQPSDTAVQQQRFCNTALSLLEQASHTLLSLPLTKETLLDSDTEAPPPSPSPDSEPSPTSVKLSSPTSPNLAYRKCALVQHLPSGDYWSSLNADIHNSSKQLKDLSLGNAELVVIFPTPSTSSLKHVPTLGSYHPNKILGSANMLPEQRRLTVGNFLDYGPWASFAPSFDHDGESVGRCELGELLYSREGRRRERQARQRESFEGEGRVIELQEMEDHTERAVEKMSILDVDTDLEGLLPEGQIKTLKDALSSLELEDAVTELLEKNRRALQRLSELQRIRLLKRDGGLNAVEEGSEEWDTARSIMDSLEILASLRPQSMTASIIPSPSVLRKLQQTLSRQPSPGWHGTLPPTKSTALRDDCTIKIRTGGGASVVPSTSTPTPTTTPLTSSATPTYPGYNYTYSQQTYRPSTASASYTPYKPTQYYQTSYLATAPPQLGQQSYYSQQAYSGGASGQQPYAAYSAWYSQYTAPISNTNPTAGSGTSSGRGTPQPPAAVPTSYGSFFATSGTPPPGVIRSPAVANTVLTNKQGAPGATTWTANAYVPQPNAVPTLPPHLRNIQGYPTQTPQQSGYYGAYTAQQPPTTPSAR